LNNVSRLTLPGNDKVLETSHDSPTNIKIGLRGGMRHTLVHFEDIDYSVDYRYLEKPELQILITMISETGKGAEGVLNIHEEKAVSIARQLVDTYNNEQDPKR